MRTVMEPMSRKADKQRRKEAADEKQAKQKKDKRSQLGFGWLKMLFTRRGFWRVWFPVAFFGAAALIALNWNQLRDGTLSRAEALRTAVIEHPEFAIRDLTITGHRQLSVHEIGAIIGLETDRQSISSLQFDAAEARDRLLANPWVESASVNVDPAGTMHIELEERVPAAIWHGDMGYFLTDKKGTSITAVDGPDARIDLPLIIGKGADKAIPQALSLLYAVPAAMLPEIRGLVWRGNRRWDVISSRGLVLKLPAENPLAAIRRYVDQNLGKRVQAYAVTAIDLRRPDEPPVIRLEQGVAETRQEMLRTLRTTYQ